MALVLSVGVGAVPARADCVALQEPVVECDVNSCVLTGPPGSVPALVDAQTNQEVPLEWLNLDDTTQLARPTSPLGDGAVLRYAGKEVRVGVRPTGSGPQEIVGQWVPQSRFICRDTPGLPVPIVAREEVFLVTVELGRPPLRGATADVWALQPGDPVPAGNTSAFSVVMPAPAFRRVGNGSETGTGAPAPADFSIPLYWNFIRGADRVAVQLVEPSGFMTAVLVVPLDTQETYVGCACDTAGDPAPTWWLAILPLVVTMRRRQSASAAHRHGNPGRWPTRPVL